MIVFWLKFLYTHLFANKKFGYVRFLLYFLKQELLIILIFMLLNMLSFLTWMEIGKPLVFRSGLDINYLIICITYFLFIDVRSF